MFKNRNEVQAYIDKLEKFVENIVYKKIFTSQGLDEAANSMALVLNKSREELENYYCERAGISVEEQAANPALAPLCPECEGEMLLRTNRQNGDKFWGCKKYPTCRGTRDSSGLSKEERKAKQDNFDQQSGFSFNKKRNPAEEVGPSGE